MKVWQDLLRATRRMPSMLAIWHCVENNLGLAIAEDGRPAEALGLADEGSRFADRSCWRRIRIRTILATDLATTHGNLGLVLPRCGRKDDGHPGIQRGDRDRAAVGEAASDANEVVLRSLAASYNNLARCEDASHAGRRRRDAYAEGDCDPAQLVKADSINRIHRGRLGPHVQQPWVSCRRAVKDWKKAELCYADAIKLQEDW